MAGQQQRPGVLIASGRLLHQFQRFAVAWDFDHGDLGCHGANHILLNVREPWLGTGDQSFFPILVVNHIVGVFSQNS